MKKILISLGVIVLLAAAILILSNIYGHAPADTQEDNNQPEIMSNPQNAVYSVDGQLIILKNGLSNDTATGLKTQYFGNEATGDLNSDGRDDVAFMLTQDGGGSGTFFYLTAALAVNYAYQGLNAVLLGDRIAPQNVQIKDGEITVNYADRAKDEPMTTAPSTGVSRYFKVTDNQLVEAASTSTAQLANPASTNCVQAGGQLVINKRGDGGEYGLCYFDDNRACEEWALLRGDCPIGGRKTTGYDTIDQSYCAWLGGSTLAEENSICTFNDGSVCLTIDLYNGKCSGHS